MTVYAFMGLTQDVFDRPFPRSLEGWSQIPKLYSNLADAESSLKNIASVYRETPGEFTEEIIRDMYVEGHPLIKGLKFTKANGTYVRYLFIVRLEVWQG